ncbi:MAG: AAA family ATPase [Patescibacteria group bacterium]
MPRVISIVNQKGGVGKTTTAINLASYLAHHGKFVLLVDLDPQGNASSGIGIDRRMVNGGVYESLISGTSIHEVTVPTDVDGLKAVPSSADLAGARVELVGVERREYRLHDAILEVRNDYDYIIIDNPPSLCLLTINGLVAADEVLVPVQTEYYALEGLGQLLNTINLVRENLKPNIRIAGAVMTMYDDRTKLSRDIFEELYRYFPDNIYRTVIPRNIKLAEAPSFGKSILHYDRRSPGGKAYKRLAREMIDQESTVRPV